MADNPRIEELRRRVEKDPASIAFAQLAEEYRRVGSLQEAVEVCRTGLAKHPAYLSARVTLGRALLELEEYDQAQTELETVLRSAPENLAAIRGLAEIHQRRGELEEALKKYQAALGIARHDPDLEESVSQLTRKLSMRSSAAAVEPKPAGTEVPAYEDLADLVPAVLEPATTEPRAPAFEEPVAESRAASLDAEMAPALDDAALGAAADEFTRALQALDEIAIDLHPTQLPDVPLDLPELKPLSADDQLVPSTDWEIAGFDAAWTTRIEPAPIPEPAPASAEASAGKEAVFHDRVEVKAGPHEDSRRQRAMLHELDSWLASILADREARERAHP